MIFLYYLTNNREQQQQKKWKMLFLGKMPRNTANSSFHFQNAAFKPLVKKRKIDLKQLRNFENNWFSSWLQLSRQASFSPAVGKSVFVVECQLALVGEIAISRLGSFNLFLFPYSCTFYIVQNVPKKSLSEFSTSNAGWLLESCHSEQPTRFLKTSSNLESDFFGFVFLFVKECQCQHSHL